MKKRYNFRKIFVPKVFFVATIFILFLIFLITRVAYISLVQGKEYEYNAITQQTTRVSDRLIVPSRGEIIDRNGEKLATSVTTYDVILDPRIFMSDESHLTNEEREQYLQELSEIIHVPYEELKSYVEIDESGELVYDVNYKVIKRDLSYEDGKKFEEANFPSSIYLEAKSQRLYPYKTLASQVIGFMRGDTSASYWGLEKYYNDYMLGEYGRYYRTYDENGLITTNNIPAKNGDTVVLTIDVTIQSILDELTKKYGDEFNAEKVSAIVMDPNSGEILGMSNYANFDNNEPSNVDNVDSERFKERYAQAETDEEKSSLLMNMWRNFAITDTFEPGSIFKPIVVASAIEEGLVDKNSTFYCPGYIIVSGQYIPCWDTHGHGEQTLMEAIANSCNPAIIEINQMLGRELFYKYQKDFGFGELTGIDLPAEVSASNFIYSEQQLNPVELATSAMGQGFSSTFIQDTVAFASLINGGYLLQPYIVSQVYDEDGTTVLTNSRTVIKQPISNETSDKMRIGLQAVVSPIGTGKKAMIEGYNIGGKTGTAQQANRDNNEYALSMIAYFPVEDPQYLINAVVYKPTPFIDGYTSAVPIVKEIMEQIILYKNIPPSKVYNITDEAYVSSNKIIANDYIGRDIVEVTKELNRYGTNFDVSGRGRYISNQIPQAGTEMSKDATLFLYTSDESDDIGTNTEIEKEALNPVPNVIGLTEDEAIRVLDNMGFDYKVTASVVGTQPPVDENQEEESTESEQTTVTQGQMVIKDQMPKEGVLLPEGTQIRLITGN